MTKPYHAGMAARNGLVSARLAAAGATASNVAFENTRGFLTAFSPETTADWDSPSKLGIEWYLPDHRLCVKKYPTCYFMHRSFDATAKLLKAAQVAPADIAEVEVIMGRGQTAVLVNERPQTGLEAKFSGHFAMAAAAILGRMGIDEVTDAVVRRDDIQAFFPKVRLTAVDEYDDRDPAHSPADRVIVRLNNGSTLDTGPITSVRGHAFDPLSTDELWEKFRECTAKTHDEADARTLFERSQEIERLESTLDLPTCSSIFVDHPSRSGGPSAARTEIGSGQAGLSQRRSILR
jgi:2-methylcitrate dehydratase PrpD